MVKQAFLFAGQGAQFVGMGKDLYEHYPVCARIYDRADKILGLAITELSFNGPEEKLTWTSISQPAIFVMSAAITELIRSECTELVPAAVAGLSLGEYNALLAAQSITFEQGLRLVQIRGRLMDEAAKKFPGTMASIIGLNKDILSGVVEESGCEIANINSPDQIVISGKNDSVARACALAKEKGARRAIPLKVSGAFHSRLMKEAGDSLAQELEHCQIKAPSIPLIANVTASLETDPVKIKKLLGAQVTQPVRWSESIEAIGRMGIREACEIGPGTVLKGLTRKIDPDMLLSNLGTAQEIQDYLNRIASKKEPQHG